MTDLDAIAEKLEAILEREVNTLMSGKAPFTDKSALIIEKLSKLLDSCIERREKRKPVDPYADISTEELAEEFE